MISLSAPVFCKVLVSSVVLLDGEPLVNATQTVLFLKFKDVEVLDTGAGDLDKGKSFFGKFVFKGSQKLFDEKLKKNQRFSVTFRTIEGGNVEEITFLGCLFYNREKENNSVVYRFKAGKLL